MAECDVLAKKNKEIAVFPDRAGHAERRAGAGLAAGYDWKYRHLGCAAGVRGCAGGLRNGALELYRQPVTFAVTDPDTKTVYKWKPAVGVAELKSREITASSLTLGIQLGDSSDPQWGPTIAIEKGTCYWTNPLILPGARSG